jgi:pilus assembly protein Flp/PilA
MQTILRFLRQDDGATAVEYAVMLGLILGAIIVTVGVFGLRTQETFDVSVQALSGVLR